ncbi:septation protein IspZ [Ralstonia pseudosolanacearum]|uniref:septation protein IspZ n=1 Tax=Ralstonia pseudosolanacearum TaxID=1310165 RepID=UPI00270C8CE6|nr:septation protein IspZ [Ralstonia pseudosolanacearum]MDO3617950.1 septation protein IspZ [Ralstonia pseudosolanacearum]
MRTLPLFVGLLWRTIVLQLIVSLAILVLIWVTGADFFHRYEKYILLKPTLIYGAFALVLLIGWLGLRVNLVRAIWGTRLSLSAQQWHRCVVALSALFMVLAVLNLIVAFLTPLEFWVNYKLFGALTIFCAGILGVSLWLPRSTGAAE